MSNLSQDFRQRMERLERNFEVSTVIFRKFEPIFMDMFQNPQGGEPPRQPRSRKHRQGTHTQTHTHTWPRSKRLKHNNFILSVTLSFCFCNCCLTEGKANTNTQTVTQPDLTECVFFLWLCRRLPCHISDVFKFCWTLFVYTKGTKLNSLMCVLTSEKNAQNKALQQL